MKTFKKDTILTVLIRFFVILSGILGSIILANTLGPKGRGELVWINSFALTIANFAYLGLPASNTYLIVSKGKSISLIFTNSFWVSIFAGLIGGTIYMFIAKEALYLVFFFLYIPSAMLMYFCGNILISTQNIAKYNYVDFINSSITLGLVFLFSFFFNNIYIYIAITTISALITAVSAMLFIKKYIDSKDLLYFNISLFKEGFKYSLKTFMITFIGFLISNGNVFFLDYYSTKTELGYFSISQQIYNAFLVIPAVIANLLFPELIRADNKWLITLKLLKQVSVIMMFLCFFTYILVKPFVSIAFGPLFEPSIYIVYSSIPAMFFISLCTILSQYLASIDLPKELVLIWVLIFIIWLISSFYLVKLKGGVGVGLSLSVSNFILFILLFFVAKRKSKYFI